MEGVSLGKPKKTTRVCRVYFKKEQLVNVRLICCAVSLISCAACMNLRRSNNINVAESRAFENIAKVGIDENLNEKAQLKEIEESITL